MNKKAVSLGAVFFGGVGSYIPVLLGWDPTGLNGLSILFGLVGGIFGIWLVVFASNKIG
jgi:hypothetical protein